MRRAGSGSERSSRAPILEIVDRLTGLGLQVGGGVFGLLTIYMLWGVITGTPPKSLYPLAVGMKAALHNIWLADEILVVSGIILLLSLTIRNWVEDVAGYILLIAGAVLRWGIPWATGISLDIGSI
ncbi:MAG: hypothetical protein NTU88_12800, partial [Armatimonadetes bacterium]|nr:hypothetical protein [Armatimonadota bacterium]